MPDNVDGDQGSDINVPNCEQSSKSGCDEFDHIKHRLYHSTLEVVAAFVAKNTRQEGQHRGVFCRELEAQGTDRVDNNDLEFVANFCHETSDLFDEPIHGGFVTSLVVSEYQSE